MTPFKAGVLAVTTLVVLTYFGFTKANPFANPYELKAMFRDVQTLKPRSPVRIAGVEVGKVTKVEPKDGGGAAEVTMELREDALPIRDDARAQIRSRIFLEGNFFVDIQPGSPSGGELDDGVDAPDHADGIDGDAPGHPRRAGLGRPQRPPDVPPRVRHRGAAGRRCEGVQPRDPLLRARLPLRRADERRAARRGPRPRRPAAPARAAAHLRGARRTTRTRSRSS